MESSFQSDSEEKMDISIGEDELQEIHDIVMTDVSDHTHMIAHEGKHKMMTDTSNYPLASKSRGQWILRSLMQERK